MANSRYEELLNMAHSATGGAGAAFEHDEQGNTYVSQGGERQQYTPSRDFGDTIYEAPNTGHSVYYEESNGSARYNELLNMAYQATGGMGAAFTHDESGNPYVLKAGDLNSLAMQAVQNDNRTALQKKVDAFLGADRTQVTGEKTNWGDLLKGAWSKGWNKANERFWSSMDFLFGGIAEEIHTLGLQSINDFIQGVSEISGTKPKYVQDGRNFIQWAKDDSAAGNAAAEEKYAKNAVSSRAAQLVDKFGTETVAALPMALMAIAEGVTGAGAATIAGGIAEAAPAGLQYASQILSGSGGIGTMSVQGIKNLLSSPNFWNAYLQVVGPSYDDAKQDGFSDDDASIYALTNSVLNAVIEVGGADEALGGIQGLPKNVRGNKSAIISLGKSALQEGMEEVQQGIVERGLKGAMTPDNGLSGFKEKWFSTDPANTKAVINPYTAGQEFLGGAVVGAVLGGGQVGLTKGAGAAIDKVNDSRAYTGDADALIRTAKQNADRETMQRIAEIQQDAKERAMKKGDNEGYSLNMGEARELYRIIQGAGKEEDLKSATFDNALKNNGPVLLRDIFKNSSKKYQYELDDEEVNSILGAYQKDQDFIKYAQGMREAYTFARNGYSIDVAGEGQFMPYLLPTQKQLAWMHGRNAQDMRRETVDISTEAGKERAVAALSGLGEQHAEAAAEVYEKTQDIEKYATAMGEAVFYASAGADLQAMYQDAKAKGYGKITYLTPAQIAKAAQIGAEIRQEQLTGEQQAAKTFEQKKAEAEEILNKEVPELAEINQAIKGMREYVEERKAARTKMVSAVAEALKANPQAANTEAVREMKRQAVEAHEQIQNTEEMLREMEERRREIRKQHPGKRKKGTVSYTGAVFGGKRYGGVDPERLTRQQKKADALGKVIADALNLDVVFFMGPPKTLGAWQGDTLFINMNGAVEGENGLKRFIVGATVSHELTHYLQAYNPEVYRELKDFVVKTILKKSPAALNDLIRKEMDIADRNGRKITREAALNEIVANACQTMLFDSKAVRQLARENMTSYEKIVDVLEEISGKIRAAFDEVNTDERVTGDVFKAVQLMKDELDTLQKIWDRGILGAAENYQIGQAGAENTLYQLVDVEPVEPTTGAWKRTHDTSEALKAYPKLWNVKAEKSEKRNPTQVASTQSTYRNIYRILKNRGFAGKILDASSGLGIGTQIGRSSEFGFDVDDIEPYPGEGYEPKFTDYSTLNEKYDAIISSAVLNVLPQDQRDALVVKMGDLLNPGGVMFVTTRGKDVDSLGNNKKNIHLGPMEWIETSRGSYQKGFTQAELKAYLQDALGDGFLVEDATAKNGGKFNNNTSIIVTKAGSTQFQSVKDMSEEELLAEIEKRKAEWTDVLNQVRELGKESDALIKRLWGDQDKLNKEYDKWMTETGYGELVQRERILNNELTAFQKDYNKRLDRKADEEERAAIKKSGQSEAEYFVKKAVKEFGYTTDFSEAGYIIPNGKMLNFSGEKGMHSGVRGQDHRAIGSIYANSQGTAAMKRFMNSGNIRVMYTTPGLDISAANEPTAEQYRVIREFARNVADDGYFAVDFTGDENHASVGALEYEGRISPERIVNDIKHYFKTGEIRSQGVSAFFQQVMALDMDYDEAEQIWNGMTEEQQEAEINASMTMQEARVMLSKAFTAGDVKEWYDGKYRNGDEWLKGEGTREVALIIENDYELQRRYINTVPVLANGFSNIEEVLDAYQKGTLTGRPKQARTRADLSKSRGYQDSRFYAPKAPKVTKETWDLANQRATKKNEAEVNEARKNILLAAHEGGLERSLGISAAELNKKLRQWSRYSSRARELSMRINQGVSPENQWTGIQNSSILNGMTITDEDIRSMVKDVNGDSSEYQRRMIGNAMLALDTHIDWSWLSFEFLRGSVDPNRRSVRGNYVNSERKIHIGGGSYQHTVSHEMGHALDYQWERELFRNVGTSIVNPLSGNAYREDLIVDDEGRAFYRNFQSFIHDLMDVNDNRSQYTMEPSEIFARFVDKFVKWTQETAGAYSFNEEFGYSDRFTVNHFIEFAKLLQEKAAWDAKQATTQFQQLKGIQDVNANIKTEKENLHKLLERDDLSQKDLADVRKRLDRLNSYDGLREVFYQQVDEIHNGWAETFYSKLNRVVDSWTKKGRPMPAKIDANQLRSWLKDSGVKDEEIKWTGIMQWAQGRKSFTKEEVLEYLAQNDVRIKTVTLWSSNGDTVRIIAAPYYPDIVGETASLAEIEELVNELAAEAAEREGYDDYDVETEDFNGYLDYLMNWEKGDRYGTTVMLSIAGEVHGDTHWMDFSTQGGTNYREILFQLPGLNYIPFKGQEHWGAEYGNEAVPGYESTIAHTRIEDTVVIDPETGVVIGKMLLVDELQSDIHNQGSTHVFDSEKYTARLAKAEKKYNDLNEKTNRMIADLAEKGREYYDRWLASGSEIAEKHSTPEIVKGWLTGTEMYPARFYEDSATGDLLGLWDPIAATNGFKAEKELKALLSEEELSEIKQVDNARMEIGDVYADYIKLRDALDQPYPDEPAPDVPFAGEANTYHELVMKHILRLAAEGGYDYVGWTTALQQGKRWRSMHLVEKNGKPGPFKILYDRAIGNFMNDYAKKNGWNTKVETVTQVVDEDDMREVWGMKLTDQMKDSVLHVGQPLFQQVDDAYDDSVEESNGRDASYTMLRSQAEILGELFAGVRELTKAEQKSIAEIQKRLNIGKTPEVRMSDARKLAKSLVESYGSTADANEIANKIKQIGDYIVQSEDPTLTVPYDLAHEIATEIVESAQVPDESKVPDDTIMSIADRIAGTNDNPTKFVLDDPTHIKDTAVYETIQEFNRDHLKFRVSVAGSNSKAYQQNPQSYVNIDQFYSELQNDYGENYFPQVSNEGEQLMVMAQLLQASAKEEYLNPFEQYMGEAIESAAQEIVHTVIGNELVLLDFDVMKLTPLNRTERLQARNKELSEKIKTLVRENKMEQREASKLYTQITRLNGKLAKAEGKYQALQQRSRERLAQVRAEGRARAAEVKARERARSAEKIYALKEYYRDMEKRARERRSNTTLRHKIRALVDELNRRLMKPSENKHIPKDLVRQTIDVLKMIDYDSGRGGVKFAERLKKIRETYDSYEKNQTYSVVYDEVTAEMLKNLQETIAGRNIYGMTEGQLNKVYETLKSLMHVIDESIKIRIGNEERDAFEVSRQMTAETRAIPKSQKGWIKQHAIPAHLRPDVAFRRFGGFKKNSAWESVVRMLNDGQLKKTDIQMRLGRPFLELTNQAEAMRDFTGMNFWGKLDKSKLIDIGLKDANGNSIKVTHDIAVGIYLDLLNEDNRMHFIRGGKTVPNLEEFYAGKGGFGIGASRAVGISEQLSELNHQMREAKEAGDEEEIMDLQEQIEDLKKSGEQYADEVKANIEKILTDFDRKWIRLTQHLMDVESKKYLNDTTMEVYGIEKATVDHYFPITSDPDFLSSPFESIVRDASPENVGFMKERIKSGNPTLAMGTFTVVNNQIDRVSQYCGIMPAIRNFNKVWNKTAAGYADSLKKAVGEVFDPPGVEYIEDLIADLNHSRSIKADSLGLSRLLGKLRGNLAQTTLTFNVRVAMAQAASYPTAAAELGVKPLAKALARGGKGGRMISRADQDLIATYSPLLYHRMQGYSSVELGDIKNSQRLTSRVWKKMRWATGWIQAVDGATVGRLWYAAEYWVQDHFPNLAQGSNEYYEQVAMKFNDVVEKTQPNYTTMQRPAMLRDPNELLRSLTMFMTQRLQNFNILYDAAGTYQKARADFANRANDVTRADVTEARHDLLRAVASQLAAAVTYVAFKLFADMLMHNMKAYRDEDDDLTKESVLLKLLDNFVDTLMGCMFLGSDVYSALKAATGHGTWYGLSLSGVDSINDLLDNFITLHKTDYDMESEKDRAKFEKQLMKVIYSVGQFLGIPANNVVKIKDAVWNHLTDIRNGEFGSFEAGIQSALSDKQLEAYKEYVESSGLSQKEYEKHLRTADVNGKSSPTQDEFGAYLVEALKNKTLTEAQAQALWKSQWHAENSKTFDKWRGDNTGEAQTEAKKPTQTNTVSATSPDKAKKSAKPVEKEVVDDFESFKKKVSLFSDAKQEAYQYWESEVKPLGVSLDQYATIINNADKAGDGNGSVKQDEMGQQLISEMQRGMTTQQAEAIWHTIWHKPKSKSFAKWYASH